MKAPEIVIDKHTALKICGWGVEYFEKPENVKSFEEWCKKEYGSSEEASMA